MTRFQAEDSTLVHRAPDEVFRFLCDPDLDPAQLTPMEDRVEEWQGLKGVGSLCRTTVSLAARDLDCVSRCVEFEPPERVVLQLEGDIKGKQTWHVTPENGDTRLHLALDLEAPQWTPEYLRDEQVAQNWGQMLVDQTLENVKEALEK